MTEIAKTAGVNRKAFFLALVISPLAFALLGLAVAHPLTSANPQPLLLIYFLMTPMAAAVIGAPAYLLIAAPLFWWAIRGGRSSFLHITFLGILAHLASLLFVAGFLFFAAETVRPGLLVYTLFGLFFATLWSLLFALLYRWLA